MEFSAAPAFTFLNPCNGRHSPEDFQYHLLCASTELQQIRANGRLQDSKLWRLQELLNMMTKERDDAREECRLLQECLLLQDTPAMGADSPSSFIHSSMVSSPSSSAPWSLQELEEHLYSDDFGSSAAAPTPYELQQALESFSQNCNGGQHTHSLFSNGKRDSHQQFHMQKLDETLCFDALPCFDVSEARNDVVGGAASSSVRALSRQSSSNSTSVSAQCFHQEQCSVESSDDTTALSPAFMEAAGMAMKVSPLSSPTRSHVMYVTSQTKEGPCMANVPPFLPSLSSNGSHVTEISSSFAPPVANSEAAIAMPTMPSMGDNVASTTLCRVPTMDDFKAPLGTGMRLPVLPSMGNSAASSVYTPSPTSSTAVENSATPVSTLGTCSAAPLMVTPACNPQPSKVSTDAEAISSLAFKDSAPAATCAPVLGIPTAGQAASMCPPAALQCSQQGISAPVRQVHLPEPPEADPQVMLSLLPEKGKLLQAVMQAGPLLQTLLLAGPLPQWRHPPPALRTGDIPRVSLAPVNVISAYPTLVPSSAVKRSMGSYPINSKSPLTTMTICRKRPASSESWARSSNKLRRLSPLPAKPGSSIHMLTRRDEQSFAADHHRLNLQQSCSL